jgi:PEP-CTERM motif-containing protein
MRKPLWTIPVLLLFAAIGAPNAHADTLYTYTFTSYGPGVNNIVLSWTTEPIIAVTGDTPLTAGQLTSASLTGTVLYPATILSVDLDDSGLGDQETVLSDGILLGQDNFAIGDYSEAGAYISQPAPDEVDVLTVSAIQTPEPSTGALMLIGIGIMLLMRKRIALCLPQAT